MLAVLEALQPFYPDKTVDYFDFTTEGFIFEPSTVNGWKFINCNFSELVLENIVFEDCKFVNCNFSHAHIESKFDYCFFFKCNFNCSVFRNDTICTTKFFRCKGSPHFRDMSLLFSRFRSCGFSHLIIKNSEVECVTFYKCSFESAHIEGSSLLHVKFLHLGFYNSSIKDSHFNRCVFNRSELSFRYCQRVNFISCSILNCIEPSLRSNLDFWVYVFFCVHLTETEKNFIKHVCYSVRFRDMESITLKYDDPMLLHLVERAKKSFFLEDKEEIQRLLIEVRL